MPQSESTRGSIYEECQICKKIIANYYVKETLAGRCLEKCRIPGNAWTL